MGIINNIFSPFRGISEYLSTTSSYKTTLHMLDNTNVYANNDVRFADEESSAATVYELSTRDTMFAALVEYIVRETIKQGFYITPRKDASGDYLFSPRGANGLTTRLQDMDFIKMISKIISSEVGDGGGNVLYYTVKRDNKVEFVMQPFWELAQKRVEIKADMDTSTIVEYVVKRFNSGETFVRLDPQSQFVYQSRYSEVGDFRFSSNPAKKAAYWYELKKNIAGANLSIYKNGIQGNLVMTPDYDQISKLIQAANNQTIPRIGNDGMEFITDPLAYFGKAQKRDVEVLRKEVANPKYTNRLIQMMTPHIFKDVTKTNSEMNTLELIAECDKQMAYGIMLSLSLLDSRQAKYSNAEVDQDNAKNSVIDYYKAKIEWLAENKILPIILAGWDKSKYRFRLGRDADAEDLEQFQQKTNRNTSVAAIISTLSTIPNYKYNLETHEIEEITLQPADEKEVQNDDIKVDDVVLEQRALDVDAVFASYRDAVNMSFSELQTWSETECSKKASLDRSPIERNLELLNTEKSKWTAKHVKWANRTISFIARMKANLGGKNILKDSNGNVCGTRAYISLKNWAYDAEKRSNTGTYKARLLRSADEYGFVVASVESPSITNLQDSIKEEDLYIDENEVWVEGRVKWPHITLGAMLKKDVTQKEIENVLTSSEIPKQITFDGIERFDNPEKAYSVLVLKAKATDELKKLNNELESLGSENKYPTYKPHLTLAYIKKDAKPDLKLNSNLIADIQDVVFSPAGSMDKISVLKSSKLRAVKQLTPSERAIESADYKRTLNTLEKAIVKQINTYTSSIKTLADLQTTAFPAIPLTVSAMKQQLLKFANQGYDEFIAATREQRALPEKAEMYIDAKAQLLLKGWDSLSIEQRAIITEITGGEFVGYKGIDKATSSRVLTLVNNGIKSGLKLDQIVSNIIAQAPVIARSRATTILNTEVPQAVEGTRFIMYRESGYQEKKWLTVRDQNVRDEHSLNESQGWIDIDSNFASGATSPAQEINCRCTLVFRIKNLDNF